MPGSITALNLCRAELEMGTAAEAAWQQVLALTRSIDSADPEQWLLDCFLALQKRGKWKFESGQALFIRALNSGTCNCSCGVQLLLCLAEEAGLLGQGFGEAKWRNHTTLAHRRRDGAVAILETTNATPRWKPIEQVPKCHYRSEFEPQLLFLHSMSELVRPSRERSRILRQCFAKFDSAFWLNAGGPLAWICWRWVCAPTERWRRSALPLVLRALELESPRLGPLLHRRLLVLFYLAAEPSGRCRERILPLVKKFNTRLEQHCKNS